MESLRSDSRTLTSSSKPFSPPFLYDPETNEPYLPLPAPLGPRYRLTPPRVNDHDIDRLVRLLNLPEIYMYLVGPPFPYTKAHATDWVNKRKNECQAVLSEMERAGGTSLVEGCPVRFIRERLDDGTDVFLGDIFAARSQFPEVVDLDERARLAEVNLSLKLGDPAIVYGFGYFLDPAYHRKGIMSAAMRTLLEDWAIPHMGARQFEVAAMSHNIGSQKIFLKNGFHFVKELDGLYDLAKMGKGEGQVGLKIYHRVEGEGTVLSES